MSIPCYMMRMGLNKNFIPITNGGLWINFYFMDENEKMKLTHCNILIHILISFYNTQNNIICYIYIKFILVSLNSFILLNNLFLYKKMKYNYKDRINDKFIF